MADSTGRDRRTRRQQQRRVLRDRQQATRERQQRMWGDVVSPDRLQAFSDGVFAIAITLLTLEIRVAPGLSSAELLEGLRGLLPDLAGYALSFFIIGQLWLAHHRIFNAIARVDRTILVVNLAVLGLVAIMPFPVRLFSDYHDRPVAVVVYAATFAAASLLQRSLWAYATRHENLLAAPVPDEVRREFGVWLITMPVAFGVAMPVALLVPRIALAVWLALIPAVSIARRLDQGRRDR